MPEQFFIYLKKKIKKEWVICFLSAMLIGLAAHMYKLVNWLPNWDSLVFRHDAMDMTHFGRWFLSTVCGISSYYDLPWLAGLLSLIYLSLGAVCVCELFGFKKKATLILTGGLIAAFPAVTSTLAYNYTADGYMLAFFFACLSVLLIEKGKAGFCVGTVLLVCVLGIYQAYLTVAVGLILLYLIDCAVFRKTALKQLLLKTVRYLCSGVLAGAFYWLMQQLIMALCGTGLSEYQGVSEAFSLSDLDFGYAIRQCIYRTKDYFFDFEQGLNLFSVLNIAMWVSLIAFILYTFFKEKLYRSPKQWIPAILFVIALPFGANLLYFVEGDVDYHNIMLMGYLVFYLFFLLFYERVSSAGRVFLTCKQWLIVILMALIVYNHVLIANISYHKLQISYEKSYSTAVRIADRVEQTEGSKQCKKMAVVGKLSGSEMYSSVLPPDITGITDGYIIRETDAVIKGQNVMLSTLKDYCGLEYEDCGKEEIEKIRQEGALDTMQPWPAENSVAVYRDTLILYLGE